MAKELWELKHRPKTMDEYVFQDPRHRELVEKFIEEKSIPHLLLSGHRGTGKTSLALLLKAELGVDPSDFLEINASRQTDVDTMRNEIHGFISTCAMGDFKLVYLEEADRLSPAAQDAAKSMMEEFADTSRFILSCNYPNKITVELKSRLTQINFKQLPMDDMLERMAIVLKKEKIKTNMETLEAYATMAYPDLRKAIQMLEHGVKDGVLQPPTEGTGNDEVHFAIVECMEKNKYADIRAILSGGMGDDDWVHMYRFLYETLDGIGKFENASKWKAGIIIIADHLYKHSMVADPEINATAMFLRLGDV